MKYFIITIIILCVACRTQKRQSHPILPNTQDSLEFVKQTINKNQTMYMGKDIDALLNDLQLSVKSFSLSYVFGANKSSGIDLSFDPLYLKNLKMNSNVKAIAIHIDVKDAMPDEITTPLVKKNKSAWTTDEKNYFGKQIIKKIEVIY